jgi:hypothetical protein
VTRQAAPVLCPAPNDVDTAHRVGRAVRLRRDPMEEGHQLIRALSLICRWLSVRPLELARRWPTHPGHAQRLRILHKHVLGSNVATAGSTSFRRPRCDTLRAIRVRFYDEPLAGPRPGLSVSRGWPAAVRFRQRYYRLELGKCGACGQ